MGIPDYYNIYALFHIKAKHNQHHFFRSF
ncbi:hypothetical protein CARN8_1420003 [mine drainage metagenome]|uniref:Uncharacterized protein n=1 Tax=mine drainage metagenome TaxID=410659 RepID=A0A3P3ZLL9_9ZZZZ